MLALGWSCTEELLCIQDDGTVLVYDLFGSFKRTFGMGQVCDFIEIFFPHCVRDCNGLVLPLGLNVTTM